MKGRWLNSSPDIDAGLKCIILLWILFARNRILNGGFWRLKYRTKVIECLGELWLGYSLLVCIVYNICLSYCYLKSFISILVFVIAKKAF